MLPKRRLTVTIVLALMSEVANKVFPLLVLYHVKRVLGLEAFGGAQFSLSLFEIMIPFVVWGFPSYGAVELARNGSDRDRVRRLLGSIVLWRTAMAGIAFAILLALVGPGAAYNVYRPFVLAGAFILFTSALDFEFVFLAKQKLAALTAGVICIKLLAAGLIVTCVKTQADATLYTSLFLGGNALISLVGFGAVVSRVGLARPRGEDMVSTIRGSLPFAFTTILLMSGERLDMLLVERFRGDIGAGLYAGPLRLVGSVAHLIGAVSRVFFSEMMADASSEHLGRTVRLEVFSLAAILVPIATGVWFVDEALLSLFYGTDFAGYGPILSTMTLGMVMFAGIHVFGFQVLLLKGRMAVVNGIVFGGYAAALALATGLSGKLGLVGIAVGFAAGKAMAAVGSAVAARAFLVRMPWRELARPVVASMAMAAVLSAIPIDRWYVTIVIGGAVYGLTLVALSRNELGEAWRLLRPGR